MKNLVIALSFCLAGMGLFTSCERDMDMDELAATQAPGRSAVQDDPGEVPLMKCPTATFSASPCDKSFRIHALFNGMPTGANYNYWIYNGFTPVDSGQITSQAGGDLTNPVLSYCTNYLIVLQHNCYQGYTYINMTSDGCNNNFLC